jgi:hypothetical protein
VIFLVYHSVFRLSIGFLFIIPSLNERRYTVSFSDLSLNFLVYYLIFLFLK